MIRYWPDKDPDDNLDYGVDWSTILGNDTIAQSNWVVPSGLVGSNQSFTNTSTTIWLSGGAVGTKYEVVNSIVTAGGREYDQTVRLRVETQ